jgi:signal transduction histidine kinase
MWPPTSLRTFLYSRPHTPNDRSPSATQLAVKPLEPFEDGAPSPESRRTSGWLNYRHLKIEAAIFLLIALTFAAVLGESAITKKQLLLTPETGQFLTYAYSDRDNNHGNTSITVDRNRKLAWSCDLRTGFGYPFCGFGLSLVTPENDRGIDFSHYRDITLRFAYHGDARHLKLIVKTSLPENLRGRFKDLDMPSSIEFDVLNGENVIHLNADQFTTEQWWVTAHGLASSEVGPQWNSVRAVAVNTGSAAPLGHMEVAVHSIAFKGAYLSTQQWYLIILGIWLVLTGTFLVYRFLNLRKGYEARQRQQAQESRALAVAHAAAEDASAAKSQFLANMSHELRTPLNAILGYAQLLKADDLTEKQASAIRTIHHSGEHLLTMITDILDIAKVEAGHMELMTAPFDIRACVATVAQMVRLRAEEKALAFTVAIDDCVPHGVIGDEKRVRQVLINLLVNAVKFTASGEVRLEISVVEQEGGHVRLRFDIADTGIGIAEDQLGRIFRPFEQAGNAIARSSGTGLGLAITHQIIGMMGGHIQVESAVGMGSRFRVEAPFVLVESQARLADMTPDAPIADVEDDMPVQAPQGEPMVRLLALARAGNMRAIRNEVPAIMAMGPQYRTFAERLDSLAAAYQSPAVLRLVEDHAPQRLRA